MTAAQNEITDWRCISQHAVAGMIEKAVSRGDFQAFAPTVLVAASTDALNVAWGLKKAMQAHTSESVMCLTSRLETYDENDNPYNPIRGPTDVIKLNGSRILLVDKADSSRASLAASLAGLQKTLPESKIGIFVLHNKRRPKEADLPEDVMANRYFSAEETDNVAISYPYHQAASQPTAHGDHPHLTGGPKRRSIDHHHAAADPKSSVIHSLSRHYIDEVLAKATTTMLDTFTPDLIIAVDETSISPASLLEHHISTPIGRKTPVLTPQWAVYEPNENPYKPVGQLWDEPLEGLNILLVEKVDATRTTLATFVQDLEGKLQGQKANATIGVFALNEKADAKKRPMPLSVKHYFAAETSSLEAGTKLSYPTG
jgi:hypoxanthine phosphoribosyltransferase